ncbi:MAG: PQQ-binding-like beta-propeller repeat protein [Deltaproteobacteria bacterium]|nr:PQQ-binding-like beta-propeller repeat protein [Deltaproteobacteria bacterium]
MLGAVLALALVALGAGCEGLTLGASPELPLWVHHPGGALQVAFRRELTARSRRVGEAYERGRPEVDPSHRRVFVGSSDHGLYALRAADGAVLWRFETAGAVQSEPLYDPGEDAVYFGSNDGALYRLRASDGALGWRFATNAEVTRRPVLHRVQAGPRAGRRVLLATNANDTLLCIEPASGEMLWFRHRTPAFGMEISGYAGPAVLGDTVFAAFSDGAVMAYGAGDGSERWRAPVDLTGEAEQARAGEELRYLDVDTTPVVATLGAGDLVFVASYEGGVFALDAGTGTRVWVSDQATGVTELVLWEQPAPPAPREPRGAAGAPPARARRVLVASSGLTGLWAFDPEDGSELWRRDVPAGGVSAAVPWAGALLVGSTRYGAFLLSPLDGGMIDGLHSGGSFAATPAAHGTRAFVLSSEGVLFGLHLQPPGRG